MESFVKIFRNKRADVACDEANIYAANRGCEILSAQICVRGEGRSYEESVLTVVYRKVRDRSKKKAGDKPSERREVDNGKDE